MKPEHKALETKLWKRRGLPPYEWDTLIEYRIDYLKSKGENPEHWNLGTPNLSKRFGY